MARSLTRTWVAVMLALLTGSPALACDGENWIRLEVTAGEMAVDRAAEWVEIDRMGCVLSSYPSWDVRHGLYERQMSAPDRAALEQLLEASRIVELDVAEERSRIAAEVASRSTDSRMDDLQTIGADTYRLHVFEHGSEKVIVWEAPLIELRLRREQPSVSVSEQALSGLSRLVSVIESVRLAGDHADKVRVEEVKP